MDTAGKPDYIYQFLVAAPLFCISFYYAGLRLEKLLKKRFTAFRLNWLPWGMVALALGLAYAVVAPAPGSQGEAVRFKSSIFGKSDYQKAVEDGINRQLDLPCILPVEPYLALDAASDDSSPFMAQAEALVSAGLYERSERMALNLSSRLVHYKLSETGHKFYNNALHGLDYGQIRLIRLLSWRYLGRRDREWRELHTTSRGRPMSSRNVAEYSEGAPRSISFVWDFTRLEDWAARPEMLAAFPLLQSQLASEDKTHRVLAYAGRIEGLLPWHDPSLPHRYYLQFPLIDFRQQQPNPLALRLNAESLHEGIDTYLYNHTGFISFLAGSAEETALRRASGPEPDWAALEPRKLYDELWQGRRRAAKEFAETNSLTRQGSSLEELDIATKNLYALGRTLSGAEPLPARPNPLPPAFDGAASGQRRFAVFQLDKIISMGAPYAMPEPDGWIYQRVSFTCKITLKAKWLNDKEVQRLMPELAELMDALDQQVFSWIVRYKEPQRAEYGGTRYECELFFDAASGSGL